MEAFQWIQDLMDLIIKWIPKPTIIKSTHGAVAFIRGTPRKIEATLRSRRYFWYPFDRRLKPLSSARWYWYWPIWTEVYEVPLTFRPRALPSQSLMVKHGKTMKTLGVDGRVEYQIMDYFKVLTQEDDVDGIVEAEVGHAVRSVLWGQQLKDIIHDADVLCEEAASKANENLLSRGMRVIAVRLSDMALCKAIRIMGLEKQGSVTPMLTNEEDE